jgi:hypothetical protein
MSAKDRCHDAVKIALLKEQWTITDDPLRLKFEDEDEIRIDLGAEHLLAAERGTQKIAIEIKSFLSESALFDYHAALGQFLNYRLVLEALEPERVLYLAVPPEVSGSAGSFASSDRRGKRTRANLFA